MNASISIPSLPTTPSLLISITWFLSSFSSSLYQCYQLPFNSAALSLSLTTVLASSAHLHKQFFHLLGFLNHTSHHRFIATYMIDWSLFLFCFFVCCYYMQSCRCVCSAGFREQLHFNNTWTSLLANWTSDLKLEICMYACIYQLIRTTYCKPN